MKIILRFGIVYAIAICLAGQDSKRPEEFDAASVRPTPPIEGGGFVVGMNGGPGTSDPSRLSYVGVTLKRLIIAAYGVKSTQITGPDWIDTDRFDITAKVPVGATRADLAKMLQDMLIKRFGMSMHWDHRTVLAYDLILAKTGSKLKESMAVAPSPAPGTPHAGTRFLIVDGRYEVVSTRQTMEHFAEALSVRLDRPVIDLTGLKGMYDFKLVWNAEALSDPSAAGVSGTPEASVLKIDDPKLLAGMFSALPTQAGLVLNQKKTQVEFLVIDHVNKAPTEN